MRVVFMGTPEFAVPTLSAISAAHDVVAVITRPDQRRGRGRKAGHSAVKEWAVGADLPVFQPATLRDPEVEARLRSYDADVFVVAAYGLILPKVVLAMPPRGCINVHGSLLPHHRGAAPIAWAILSGDRKIGITTMLMDEGLDTGPMLLKRSMQLGPADTTGSITPALAAIGAELLVETLAAIDAIVPELQVADEATLAPSFKKSDGVLDWHLDATVIDRRVRALQPWPGTFTFWGGERLAIWGVRVVADDQGEVPGTVLEASHEVIRVACGQGAVDIVELQRSGGRRQSAAEFVRGRPVTAGERFGPSAD